MLFFFTSVSSFDIFFINNQIIRLQKLKQKPLLEKKKKKKKKKRHIRYWNWLIGNLTVSLLINMK